MTEIELRNIKKEIKGVPVLQNITLSLKGGKVYGLQGKNGSGKTMLMRAVCGLIQLTEGEIIINGETLHKEISFPRSVGALIETPSFLDGYTGFQNLRLLADIAGNISDMDLRDCLEKVGLNPDDKRIYKKYSLGMKQKLGIAAAIMGKPDIVILDEPINAIDEKGVENVKVIIRELKSNGSVVIVACHDREELEELSDVIIRISEGKICESE